MTKEEDTRGTSSRNPTRVTRSSSVELENSDLGKYCAFPSLPVDHPALGPSELIKAMRDCTTDDEVHDLEKKNISSAAGEGYCE